MLRPSALVMALTVAASALPARPATAQSTPLTRDDSSLVLLVLQAEESRDSLAPAIANGLQHRDARVRSIAARARARIGDPLFAARAQHVVPPPVTDERDVTTWPEPAWKARYRAVRALRDTGDVPPIAQQCTALRTALTDAAWPVRQRAASFVRGACAEDDTLAGILRSWVDALGATTPARGRDGTSWQPAAHGLLAYARLRGNAAHPLIQRLATHPQWQVRQYAARAAGESHEYATLRRLARDSEENVAEAAIEWLAVRLGHAEDSIYIAALSRDGVPSVFAAANALRGSTHPQAAPAAARAFERFAARLNASERDVRHALLNVANRRIVEDQPPPRDPEVPPEAAGLALGQVRYLRVEMSEASGGRSFLVRLRGDLAPIMAARVLTLARDGWYDNSMWQRAEYDFVLQGGGPGANEYVGYKQYFVDELGTVAHPRGSIGMSTRGHDTGDAQWFINLRDNPRLLRDFTVFAEVVEDMDVVDAIVEGDVIARIREVRR